MKDLPPHNQPGQASFMGILRELLRFKNDKRKLYALQKVLVERNVISKASAYRIDNNNPAKITMGVIDEAMTEIGTNWIECAPLIQKIMDKAMKRRK